MHRTPPNVSPMSNDGLARLQPRPTKIPAGSVPNSAVNLPYMPALQPPAWAQPQIQASLPPRLMDSARSKALLQQPIVNQIPPDLLQPPRLAARLKELELGSLLSLCERLEPRLCVQPARPSGFASNEELEELAQDIAGPLTGIVRRAAHDALESKFLVSAAPESKRLQEAPVSNELDKLLRELNEILQVAMPSISQAAPTVEKSSPAVAFSVPPLEDAAGAKGRLAPSPSFLDALRSMRSQLDALEGLYSDEVARATKDLRDENASLSEQLEQLRNKPHLLAAPLENPEMTLPGQVSPCTPVGNHEAESQTALDWKEVATPTSAAAGPSTEEVKTEGVFGTPRADDVAAIDGAFGTATRTEDVAIVKVAEDMPDRPLSTQSRSERFILRPAFRTESLPSGLADWGEDMEEFAKESSRKLRGKVASRWRFHELSRRRMAFDMLGLLLLVYDVLMTPFNMAFGNVSDKLSEVMSWVFPLFWLLDIMLTIFFTTFCSGGVLQTGRKAILRRYARSGWLLLDSLWVCLDMVLLSVYYDLDNQSYQMVRDVILRKGVYFAIQTLRVMRILRMQRNMTCIAVRVRSEYLRPMFGLAVTALFVLLGAHVAACGLMYLGSASGADQSTWFKDYAGTQDRDTQYLTALLWALSQLTPGAPGPNFGESPFRSVPDLVYAVMVHVIALLALCLLLGSVAGFILELHVPSEWPRCQALLRGYLYEGAPVPLQLQYRIWSWLELEPLARVIHARVGARHLALVDVRGDHKAKLSQLRLQQEQTPIMFSILPPHLRQELLGHVCGPLLVKHPFFHELDVAHPQALQQVIECLSQVFVEPGQDLFVAGSTTGQMIFVRKGELKYTLDARASGQPSGAKPDARLKVSAGGHASEASLWLQNWTHSGHLTAAEGVNSYCSEVWMLESSCFSSLLRRGPLELWQAASSYASAFARRANMPDASLTDLESDSDLLLKLTEDAFADAAGGSTGDDFGKKDVDGIPG
ncbi:unnamed protein product [Polarella glacialis]|uniref:Cyclic nucleotide-binding domain-containing protein n=1 Tax=Polarella glacialis TaxID=89957 RepID=A0A813EL05_POLGL|nr:unnamed protein product [Polarella glacialis]